jgi:hypothetical protein
MDKQRRTQQERRKNNPRKNQPPQLFFQIMLGFLGKIHSPLFHHSLAARKHTSGDDDTERFREPGISCVEWQRITRPMV